MAKLKSNEDLKLKSSFFGPVLPHMWALSGNELSLTLIIEILQ